MADKRMFSKTITESDAFLEMPLSTQALYFHLSMQCDDDGFTNSAMKVRRMIGANKNDYDLLIAKNFILEFEDGVVVVKHWLMHNYIRADRYKPTVYEHEKAQLFVKTNKAYTLDISQSADNAHIGIPVVDADKISIDKDNIIDVQSTHDYELFFEEVWSLYPVKKGKARIKTSTKKKLFKLGDEFKRCIERYVDYANSLKFAYNMQHGSTFFNGGYVDYLDENYQEQPKQTSDWRQPIVWGNK